MVSSVPKILAVSVFMTCIAGTLVFDSRYPVIAAESKAKLKLGDEGGSSSPDPIAFNFDGLIRYTGAGNTYPDQEPRDAVVKNELRHRAKLKCGTENAFLYVVNNAYINARAIDDEYGRLGYSEKSRVLRNGTLSSRYGELSFNECYFNYKAGPVRLRAGNQNFAWGTADVYNPTSYFNPNDFREFITREDDELTMGVPALSSMFYFGDIVLETVFAPVHVAAAMPSSEGFWRAELAGYPFDIVVDDAENMEISPKNFAYGARLSGSMFGADVSVSGYHGPDKEPLTVPDHTNLYPDRPVELVVVPRHFIVNKAGFDFSMNLDKFVVQCEAAYSPDKRGVPRFDEIKSFDLPLKEEKSHYVAYSAGFNYFIPMTRLISGHEGDTVLTMEWFQSKYFNDELEPPLLTDIIAGRIEDGYFSGRLKIFLTAMYDTRDGGHLAWPKIQVDFQNGLVIELSYVYINGDGDSLMGYYRDNDLVMLRVRYEY